MCRVMSRVYSKHLHRDTDLNIIYDEANTKRIYGSDLRLIVKSTKDSTATISVEKTALGVNYISAQERAKDLNYTYEFKNNTLTLL